MSINCCSHSYFPPELGKTLPLFPSIFRWIFQGMIQPDPLVSWPLNLQIQSNVGILDGLPECIAMKNRSAPALPTLYHLDQSKA